MQEVGFGELLTALPVAMTAALLATLVALLWWSRRRGAARRAPLPAELRGGTAAPMPSAASEAEKAAGPAVKTAVEAAPAAAVAPARARGASVAIPERIAQMGQTGETARLSELHLEHARELLAAGDRSQAAEELRNAIRNAARFRQHGTHAAARLMLGDLAEQDGDLTTACEHWQIARSLFQDLAAQDQLKGAEGRMRRIGCPTDWVLNDF